jgi:hypothetical protein
MVQVSGVQVHVPAATGGRSGLRIVTLRVTEPTERPSDARFTVRLIVFVPPVEYEWLLVFVVNPVVVVVSPQSQSYVRLGHVPPQSTDAVTLIVSELGVTEAEKVTAYDTSVHVNFETKTSSPPLYVVSYAPGVVG